MPRSNPLGLLGRHRALVAGTLGGVVLLGVVAVGTTRSHAALIEHRFGLKPVGPRDASARDLRADFSFK